MNKLSIRNTAMDAWAIFMIAINLAMRPNQTVGGLPVKVVVFASSKGGVGKTTLAFNAAIHASKTAAVQMADRDPQRSLVELCRRRHGTPELKADNPQMLDGVETVASAIDVLEQSGYARDFLIVDTPGSFMDIVSEAVAVADVVVLPIRPSPFDLLAMTAVLDIVRALGKEDRMLFVLNMVDARSDLTADALKAIRPLSPNQPVQIANRTDYARAPITARAGIEINRDAAAEIGVLWDAITRIAKRVGKNDGKKVYGKSRGSAAGRARRARSPRG